MQDNLCFPTTQPRILIRNDAAFHKTFNHGEPKTAESVMSPQKLKHVTPFSPAQKPTLNYGSQW